MRTDRLGRTNNYEKILLSVKKNHVYKSSAAYKLILIIIVFKYQRYWVQPVPISIRNQPLKLQTLKSVGPLPEEEI